MVHDTEQQQKSGDRQPRMNLMAASPGPVRRVRQRKFCGQTMRRCSQYRGTRQRDGARRHAIQGADRAAQDFRARARRMAWRLVLAAGVGLARAAGPQGVHADADWRRRALAPHEQGYQSRHAHHRRCQCHQMGGPQGHAGGPFLRRLARLGRARADPRVLNCVARRVQAGEWPAWFRLRLRL